MDDNNLIDLAKGLLPDKSESSSKEDAFVNLLSVGKSSPEEIAEELGITHEELDTIAYTMLVNFFSKGRSAGDKDIDTSELKSGTSVEMEHTDDKHFAEKIARDHLAELPDYYTRLEKMEDEPGAKREY